MLSIFIWFRFIRERLPRTIPFDLSILGFFILLYICSIYLFIIITLLFDFAPKGKIIDSIINIIFKPLHTLDETLKNNLIIKKYYKKILIYFILWCKILNSFYNPNKESDYLHIYYIFQIYPRIILVIALLADTFWLHYLSLIYKVLIVSVLLLIYKYILYSLKYAKEQYILQLENMVERIITDDYSDPDEDPTHLFLTLLEVRKFIDLQVNAIVFEDKAYSYKPYGIGWVMGDYRNNFFNTHNMPSDAKLTMQDYEQMTLEFYEITNILIPLSVHIEEFDLRSQFYPIKHIKIIIFSLYLICWVYILIVSFKIELLQTILNISDKFEPFSGLVM